jgi:hypothetical protein
MHYLQESTMVGLTDLKPRYINGLSQVTSQRPNELHLEVLEVVEQLQANLKQWILWTVTTCYGYPFTQNSYCSCENSCSRWNRKSR